MLRIIAVVFVCFLLFTGCWSAGTEQVKQSTDDTYSYGGLPMDDPLRSTAEFKAGGYESGSE